MSIPKKLYKYESFSIQSLLNLKSQTVYFAPPSGFNDPYDCVIKAELQELTSSEIDKMREFYTTKDWPQHVIEKLKSTAPEKLNPMLMRAAREASEKVFDTFIHNKGVSCFSEVNDELLMWAHYADKYKGFCLEFNTDNELFEKAKKVTYVKDMPKLNMVNIFSDGERGDVLNLFCTKSKAWEYEQEWRCIHGEAGTAYGYPVEALSGVYFGPNIDRDALEIVCLILQGQNPQIRFWQGKRSDSTFKVEFKEVFYTPHIKANT